MYLKASLPLALQLIICPSPNAFEYIFPAFNTISSCLLVLNPLLSHYIKIGPQVKIGPKIRQFWPNGMNLDLDGSHAKA